MKILLSYSYHHFDPDKPLSEQPNRNSSAGILARTLHNVLSEIGEVTYTDGGRYQEHLGKDFDLFVGIASHFHDILKAERINIKSSVLIAVNMHPEERNKILRRALKDLQLPQSAVCETDIVDPKPYLEAIDMADFILCAGNTATYNSYIVRGVHKSKIKLFNYGLIEKPHLTRPTRSHRTKRYLYLASEIGLRKGFDLVYETFMDARIASQDFQLDIVGTTATPYHAAKIKRLQAKLGNKLKYHGWVSSSLPEYHQLLSQTDFLVFPTLEEGQAGTVVEAVAHGVVPLLSANSGIDFSPLGQFGVTGSDHKADNISLVTTSLKVDSTELQRLKQETTEYYLEYHDNFQEPLKESLGNVLQTGQLYPKISFILAINNKQDTILELIEYLHASVKNYPTAEVHVIFDGCYDKSEKIVRKYFRRVKPDYDLFFYVTPDIFEVHSNNLGLKKSTGKYCYIIQDDNYLYEPDFLYESVNFLDRNPNAVVLGGLGGVNFYPLGTKLVGKGQITMNNDEVYWRQDAATDKALLNRVFQVDACMRGPLIFRKSFMEEFGYLDEVYAPIHDDDMDFCLRANALGYKVYCMLTNVENKMESVSKAGNPAKSEFFATMMSRNAKVLYSRWTPTAEKDYAWINRTPLAKVNPKKER